MIYVSQFCAYVLPGLRVLLKATGSNDCRVKIWEVDIARGAVSAVESLVHESQLTSLAPFGARCLVATCATGDALVWYTRGVRIWSLQAPGGGGALACSFERCMDRSVAQSNTSALGALSASGAPEQEVDSNKQAGGGGSTGNAAQKGTSVRVKSPGPDGETGANIPVSNRFERLGSRSASKAEALSESDSDVEGTAGEPEQSEQSDAREEQTPSEQGSQFSLHASRDIRLAVAYNNGLVAMFKPFAVCVQLAFH